MMLEDFFTLTEMKDGLTAPARVKELITVMQKEKDCISKDDGEATNQWSIVASAIAATENKDCLDLFVQLDGLWFIGWWLKDCQNICNDTGESFVEESVTSLLLALEKLHIDNEKSVSSGIWMIVKNLLVHNNSKIQDRARALFDRWKQDRDSGAVPQVVENVEPFLADETKESAKLGGEIEHLESYSGDISLSRGSSSEEKHAEPSRDNVMASTNSDALQSERIDDVQTVNLHKTVDQTIMNKCSPDLVGSSAMSSPVNENLPIKEGYPANCSEGTTSSQTCISTVPKEGGPVVGDSDFPELNEYADDAKPMPKISSSPDKVGSTETASAIDPTLSPRTGAPNALESLTEPGSPPNDKDLCLKDSPLDDVGVRPSNGKTEMDTRGSSNQCRSTLVLKISDQGGECSIDELRDFSGNKQILGKHEDPATLCSSIEDDGTDDEDKVSSSDEGRDDLANECYFLKPIVDAEDSDVFVRSDVLDYGMVDPLEVARQVAIEVEREVIECREPSCSLSDKTSRGGIPEPDSPDSVIGRPSQTVEGPPEELTSGLNPSAEDSTIIEDPRISIENLDAKLRNSTQDTGSSQITQSAQEREANTEKSSCDFDLNQEVCSEDIDRQSNPVSTPVSIVSASRAVAAPGVPFATLQFEGTLGWKGSAATSAFLPASPRRNNEGDKTLSTGGSCSSSRQRLDCLDIDLNLTECGEEKIMDLLPAKQIQVSSCLPSGESSLEASSKRSERLKLDLNCVGDDGDAPSDRRMERELVRHWNGHHSQSPPPSSSMQFSSRNIDLNDQPTFFSESSDHPFFGKAFHTSPAFGGLKSDDSAISIFGTRVEVNRKDFVSETKPLLNSRIPEPAMDVILSRSGGVLGMGSTLPQAPVYGYNGLMSGHTMPFFSSAMYGPGGPTYVVDPRGGPLIPQMIGSTSTLPLAFLPPSPFIMGMTGTTGSNGAGPSCLNFDLNSGLMIEGGKRESTGVLRQLFDPGQEMSMDEHTRASSRPSSSSGIGVKRKEPDSFWEPYPINFKHQQSPWK